MPQGADGLQHSPSAACGVRRRVFVAEEGWACEITRSPDNGVIAANTLELGYMPFETSGEALQASTGRCDLEATSKYV